MVGVDPERWVESHGDFLFRQALARVRQRETAEDLVQETFLAAWQSRQRFAGRASEKTWLLGILRNKIVDHYRRLGRENDLSDMETLAELEEKQFHSGWLGGAHWDTSVAPRNWSRPEQSLEQSEFWSALHECTRKLPGKIARVFMLRDVEEWASERICHELRIKPSHLFVMLHRARLALRRCLEVSWFKPRPGLRERQK